MKGPLTTMTGATALVIIMAYFQGGTPLLLEGFRNAYHTMVRAIPLILAAFLLIGQVQQLISTQLINRLILRFSGWRGIAYGSALGGIFPAPPYVYYPFMASLRGKGIPLYLFLSFLSGKQVYDLARFPMEVSLISPSIACLRLALTLPLPLSMGLVTRCFFGEASLDDICTQHKGKEAGV